MDRKASAQIGTRCTTVPTTDVTSDGTSCVTGGTSGDTICVSLGTRGDTTGGSVGAMGCTSNSVGTRGDTIGGFGGTTRGTTCGSGGTSSGRTGGSGVNKGCSIVTKDSTTGGAGGTSSNTGGGTSAGGRRRRFPNLLEDSSEDEEQDQCCELRNPRGGRLDSGYNSLVSDGRSKQRGMLRLRRSNTVPGLQSAQPRTLSHPISVGSQPAGMAQPVWVPREYYVDCEEEDEDAIGPTVAPWFRRRSDSGMDVTSSSPSSSSSTVFDLSEYDDDTTQFANVRWRDFFRKARLNDRTDDLLDRDFFSSNFENVLESAAFKRRLSDFQQFVEEQKMSGAVDLTASSIRDSAELWDSIIGQSSPRCVLNCEQCHPSWIGRHTDISATDRICTCHCDCSNPQGETAT